MINREDMLELTRRMTVKRSHFSRIVGCYVDEKGEFDGSFNRAFLKLTESEREKNLLLAKSVPFAGTNEKLQEHYFSEDDKRYSDIWKLLMALRECELKNDALLDVFYDLVMEKYKPKKSYAIFLFYGAYDIPKKSSAKEYQGESEHVYKYLICTISPLQGEYEPGKAVCGFLFPAFSQGYADLDHIDLYSARGKNVLME